MAETYKNAIDADVAATRADLYVCPAATTAILVELTLANIDGANEASIDVELYDDSAAAYAYLLKSAPIPVGSTIAPKIKVFLETGDKICVTASVAGDVSAVASILEMT